MKKTIIIIFLALFAAGASVITIMFLAVPASIQPKTFGGAGYDSVRAICTAKQGYMLAGMTTSSGIGYVDAYMLAIDGKGIVKWVNTFGGKEDDRIYDIINNGDGYILAGYTSSYGAGANDFYLISTDTKGDMKYTKTFGGAQKDEAYSVTSANDGGYVLAGMSESFKKAGFPRLYVVKTDSDGDCVWSKTYGQDKYDVASSVIKASDDGYIICGTTTSSGYGMQDVLLLKLDDRGNTVWARTFGGPKPDFGSRVIAAQDSGYIVIGTTSSFGAGNTDIYLIKTDVQGNSLWTRTYGGPGVDQGVSVLNSGDGGYLLGATSESFSNGSSDILLIAVNASGDTLWSRHFGGSKDEYLGGFVRDKDGGYAVAGWTASSGAGDYDAYFFKVKKNGDF